jgi:hypothetical protein
MPTSFSFASSQVSAAGTVQLCATHHGGGTTDPAAFNAFVAVFIP